MRTPEMYVNAIHDVDWESDSGHISRPTETAAMGRVFKQLKAQRLREEIDKPKKAEKSPNVKAIYEMLDEQGRLRILTSGGGTVNIHNAKLITVELQRRGYYWVMESAVRVAQRCRLQELAQ